MNNHKITALCVHDKKKFKTIGIVHIHNILHSNIFKVFKNNQNIYFFDFYFILSIFLYYNYFKNEKELKSKKKIQMKLLTNQILLMM